MAWLYRRKRSPYWWVGYRIGKKQVLRSTGETDREEAEKVRQKLEAMFSANRAEMLTRELFENLTGAKIPKVPLKAELDRWLAEYSAPGRRSSLAKYKQTARDLIDGIGATDDWPTLDAVTPAMLSKIILDKAARVRPQTVNNFRIRASCFFNRCVRLKLMAENPIKGTKKLRVTEEDSGAKRAFTREEVRAAFEHAPSTFWRYMVLGGFYTALRLGDLATLRWKAVDFSRNQISLNTRKTGAKAKIPMAPMLSAFLEKLHRKAKDTRPDAFLFPTEAEAYVKDGGGTFSSYFTRFVLKPAGLTTATETGGRTTRRALNELSFHSLRKTLPSLLAEEGVPADVTQAMLTHQSAEIHRIYRQIPEATLAAAMGKMPELKG